MNLKGECIMQEALIQIVLYTIKENYQTEKDFFSSQLSISQENWERWKNGDEQTIINLFTDYEWMLVQKVIRNATFFPEVEANPVEEYVGIKFHVAKKWVNSGTAELAFQQENEKESDGQHRKKNSTVLKIDMNYDIKVNNFLRMGQQPHPFSYCCLFLKIEIFFNKHAYLFCDDFVNKCYYRREQNSNFIL